MTHNVSQQPHQPQQPQQYILHIPPNHSSNFECPDCFANVNINGYNTHSAYSGFNNGITRNINYQKEQSMNSNNIGYTQNNQQINEVPWSTPMVYPQQPNTIPPDLNLYDNNNEIEMGIPSISSSTPNAYP
eukprot:185818_1